jgi:hypothetical protein
MIIYAPFLLFAVGGLIAYGSAGRRRQVATVLMVIAAAWSLAFLAGPGAAAWGVGPALASLGLRRPPERLRASFEGLTRRAMTLAGLLVLALFLASRLTVGENPLLLSLVPWLLGAVGAAWVLSPMDEGERRQGQVLAVGAGGALLLAAIPSGFVTAAVAGAMALVPLLSLRARVPAELRAVLGPLLVLLAAALAIVASAGVSIPRQSLLDLSVTVDGPLLAGVAVILVAAALVAPAGMEWASLLAVGALVAVSPAIRWSAAAALLSVATVIDRTGERVAWLAFAALSSVPLLQAIAPPSWSARAQAVALATGLVVMLYAARTGILRVLMLPTVVVIGVTTVGSLSAANLTRFQWAAAAGVLLLLGHAVLVHVRGVAGTTILIGDRVILGLMLVGLSARDSLGLGALAVVLLLIAFAITRLDQPSSTGARLDRRLRLLARSNWPPSISFAGASLTVIAALPASLALGLLAAGLVAVLQLAPLIEGQPRAPAPERPGSSLGWISPALSIACGVAPSLVLRMLRL